MWKAFGGRSERDDDRERKTKKTKESGKSSSSGRKKRSGENNDDDVSVVTSASRSMDPDRKRRHKDRGESDHDRGEVAQRSSRTVDTRAPNQDDENDWESDEDDLQSRRSYRAPRSEDYGRRDSRDGAVSSEHASERKRTGKDSKRRKSSKAERDQRDENDQHGVRSRALPDTMDRFEGVTNGTAIRPAYDDSQHTMSGALPLDAHVPNQFPGQMPDTYAKPASELNPHGAAADYYNDQGQSVAHQPGIRPNTPMMLHNPDTHLITPLTAAAPAADTGNGSAADFYSGKVSPVNALPGPVIGTDGPTSSNSKPGKKPSKTSTGLAAAVTAAAAGSLLSGRPQRTSSSSLPFKPTRHDSAPAFSPSGNVYSAPAAVTGKYDEAPRPSNNTGVYTAAGAAALGAAAYGLSHTDERESRQPSTPGRRESTGQSLHQQYHQHRSPMEKLKDGLLDLIADPDDVRKMEAYTEYIGVCKHCFDPRSSPFDGPRKHHYHPRKRDSFESLRRKASYDRLRRKSSGERIGMRVEKESRYGSSNKGRGTSRTEMAGLGALGAGAVATGAMLWGNGKDFDDTYSVKSGRAIGTSERRRSRSRSGSRERRHSTSYGVIRPDHEQKVKYMTVRTKDGKLERRKVLTRSRSRSRSRDRSRDRSGAGARVLAATSLGAAAVAASSGRRSSHKHNDAEKVMVRRRGSESSRSSRSASPGLADIFGFSSRSSKPSKHSRRSPVRSAYAVSRRGSSPRNEGMLGGFFAEPKSHGHRKKKSERGFFSLASGSASSSDDELAFGDHLPERRRLASKASRASLHGTKKPNRRTSDERLTAAVAGIGVTAAALAAAQRGQHISKRSSKPELGARRHTREIVDGRTISGAEPEWEDELPSDASDASSHDSGLAFGADGRRARMSRQSMDSIASKTSEEGLAAWAWRWGGKKQNKSRKQSAQAQNQSPMAEIANEQYGRPSMSQQSVRQASMQHAPSALQYVDPKPLSEHGSIPPARRSAMPGAFDDSHDFSQQRPGPAPLQQPQPVAPFNPSFSYDGTEDPMITNKLRRAQTDPIRKDGGFIQDAALIGGAAIVTAGILATQGGRRQSNVRFADDQERKEEEARAQRREQELIEKRQREERTRQLKEEAILAAKEEDERRRREQERRQREAREEDDRRRRDQERKQREIRDREAAAALAAAEEDRKRAAVRREAEARQEAARQEATRFAEERSARERYEAEERSRRDIDMEKQRAQREAEESMRRRVAEREELERRHREQERSDYEKPQRRGEREPDDESQRRERRVRSQPEMEEYMKSDMEDRSRGPDSSRSKRYSEDEREPSKGSSWKAPVAAGVAGAVVGSILDGARHKEATDSNREREAPISKERADAAETTKPYEEPPHHGSSYSAKTIEPSNEHSGAPITDDDLFDPDFFKRKRSQSETSRHNEATGRAADKMVSDREAYYNAPVQSQAEVFAPKELLSRSAKEKETSTDPMGGNEVQVWHASEEEVRRHFEHPLYSKDMAMVPLHRTVPKLNVIAPTPPPAQGPLQRVQTFPQDPPTEKSVKAGQKTSASNERRQRAVSWGQDQTHVYHPQTPESQIERDSYISSREIPSSAQTPLDEIVVEEEEEDGTSRSTRYNADDIKYRRNEHRAKAASSSAAKHNSDDEAEVEDIGHGDGRSARDEEPPLSFNKQAFFDTAAGISGGVDSPGTEGAPPVRGWVDDDEIETPTPKVEVEPRLPETTVRRSRSEDDDGIGRDETTGQEDWSHLSKKERKKREKLLKRSDVAEVTKETPEPAEPERTEDSPIDQNVDEEYFTRPLSKKEKKKKEKAGKRSSTTDSMTEDNFVDAPSIAAKTEIAEPEIEPILSKKEKKKRQKAAQRYLDDENSGSTTPTNEQEDVDPDQDAKQSKEVEPLSTKEKSRLGSFFGRSGFGSVVDTVRSAGGIAALAGAGSAQRSTQDNEEAKELPDQEEDWSMPSKKDKRSKRKKSLGEATDSDPRDIEVAANLEHPDKAIEETANTQKSKRSSGMPGGWDEEESSRDDSVASDLERHDAKPEPEAADAEDLWAEVPAKKSKKSKGKRDSGLHNEPAVSSPLRAEVRNADHSGDASGTNGNYDRRHQNDSDMQDERYAKTKSDTRVLNGSTSRDKPAYGQAYDDDNNQQRRSASSEVPAYAGNKIRTGVDNHEADRARVNNEDSEKYASSKTSEYRSDQARDWDDEDPRPISSQIDARDPAPSKREADPTERHPSGEQGNRNERSEDDETATEGRRRHRRRRTGSEYGEDDYDAQSTTSSSSRSHRRHHEDDDKDSDHRRRHRTREPGNDDDQERRHHHRHRSGELSRTTSRTSDDQSFLDNRVEDLPPLPASRPTSPASATEKEERDNGKPDSAAAFGIGLVTSAAALAAYKHQDNQSHRDDNTRVKKGEEDLPSLPASQPESPVSPVGYFPRPGFPIRPSSSTAVPLRFRQPPSTPQQGHSRDGSLTSPIEPSSKSPGPGSRQKTIRGRTSDVHSGEFKPLYLPERHSKSVELVNEDLPSLPSSKPSSRASSVHHSDDYHSAAESIYDMPEEGSQLRIDTAFNGAPYPEDNILGSQQSTPKAGTFEEAYGLDGKQEPQFYTWEDLMREHVRSLKNSPVKETDDRASSAMPKTGTESVKQIMDAPLSPTNELETSTAISKPQHKLDDPTETTDSSPYDIHSESPSTRKQLERDASRYAAEAALVALPDESDSELADDGASEPQAPSNASSSSPRDGAGTDGVISPGLARDSPANSAKKDAKKIKKNGKARAELSEVAPQQIQTVEPDQPATSHAQNKSSLISTSANDQNGKKQVKKGKKQKKSKVFLPWDETPESASNEDPAVPTSTVDDLAASGTSDVRAIGSDAITSDIIAEVHEPSHREQLKEASLPEDEQKVSAPSKPDDTAQVLPDILPTQPADYIELSELKSAEEDAIKYDPVAKPSKEIEELPGQDQYMRSYAHEDPIVAPEETQVSTTPVHQDVTQRISGLERQELSQNLELEGQHATEPQSESKAPVNEPPSVVSLPPESDHAREETSVAAQQDPAQVSDQVLGTPVEDEDFGAWAVSSKKNKKGKKGRKGQSAAPAIKEKSKAPEMEERGVVLPAEKTIEKSGRPEQTSVVHELASVRASEDTSTENTSRDPRATTDKADNQISDYAEPLTNDSGIKHITSSTPASTTIEPRKQSSEAIATEATHIADAPGLQDEVKRPDDTTQLPEDSSRDEPKALVSKQSKKEKRKMKLAELTAVQPEPPTFEAASLSEKLHNDEAQPGAMDVLPSDDDVWDEVPKKLSKKDKKKSKKARDLTEPTPAPEFADKNINSSLQDTGSVTPTPVPAMQQPSGAETSNDGRIQPLANQQDFTDVAVNTALPPEMEDDWTTSEPAKHIVQAEQASEQDSVPKEHSEVESFEHHKEEQMPSTSDFAFAAALATGLAESGFDPELVIANPAYHRRASPPALQPEATSEEFERSAARQARSRWELNSDTSDVERAPVSPTEAVREPKSTRSKDDFHDVLTQSLTASGFDAALVPHAISTAGHSDNEADTDLAFSTFNKKKSKQSKKRQATQQSSTRAADVDVPPESNELKTLAPAADAETESDIVEVQKAASGPQDPSPSTRRASQTSDTVHDEQRHIPRDQRSDQITSSTGPMPQDPAKENDVAPFAARSEQNSTSSSLNLSSEPSGAADILGGETEMTVDEMDEAYRNYKRNKRKAKKMKYKPAESEDHNIEADRGMETSAQSSTAKSRQPESTPPNSKGTEPEMTGAKAETMQAIVLPALAGAAVVGGLLSGVEREKHDRQSRDLNRPHDISTEPQASWSFAGLDAQSPQEQHESMSSPLEGRRIRDSGYQSIDTPLSAEPALSPQMTTTSTRQSGDSPANKSPLKIDVAPTLDWNMQVPKQRRMDQEEKPIEAVRSRTPSQETPLEPTSRNRGSYLFQSPPDTMPDTQAKNTPTEREQTTPTRSGNPEQTNVLRDHDDSPPATDALGTIIEESAGRKRSINASHIDAAEQDKPSRRRLASPEARSATGPRNSRSPEAYGLRSVSSPIDARLLGLDSELSKSAGRRILSDTRSPSVLSTLSNGSMGIHRMSEDVRSFSRASSGSGRGGQSHGLRRSSMSGDLRAASRTSSLRGSAVGQRNSPKTIPFEPPPTPPSYEDDEEVAPGASRAADMAEVFQGYGDRHSSQFSPSRPPTVRKRQSMHIIELENRLDQLAAENRSLSEARNARSHSHDSDDTHIVLEQRELELREKDAELHRIQAMLQPLQAELARLNEINDGLTEANRNLVDDTNGRYATLQTEHQEAHQNWQSATRELDIMKANQVNLASNVKDAIAGELSVALAEKDSEIHRLREELEVAAEKIRSLHVQLQSQTSRADDYLSHRDEDYFDGACQKLCQHAQQWVLRFSKSSDNRICRLSTDLHDDKIEARLDNAILDGSNVDRLLGDRVKRRDVFMSVVTTMIWEHVFTRYLFGMDREQRQKLKQLEKTLSEVGPPRAVAQWRATTLTLLSKRDSFAEQCDLDTEAVANEIFTVVASLLPPPSNAEAQLIQSLQRVIRVAVELSIEMRTQRAEYIMLPPLQPEYDSNGDLVRKMHFNAALMNERSGLYSSNEELEADQAVVKLVLFPPVVKKGDDFGEGAGEIVVCPAQVLVHNDGGKGKKVVRVMSGAMDIDDRQSLISTAPGQSVMS